jgi:hypothetical protein
VQKSFSSGSDIDDAKDALAQAEDGALAQISDVEQMRRTVADLKNLARSTRLATEKLVKAEKDARRSEKVMAARAAFNAHVLRLQQDCKGVALTVPMPDFATAIKGLSSLASIDQKLTATLLESQANANTVAGRVVNNLKMLDSVPEYASLFPDRQELSHKDSEVLELLMHKRVADHQAAQAQRLVAERHAEGLAQQVIQQAASPSAPPLVASEPPDDGARINLGAINEHLAPIKLDATGLAALGFEPVATVKVSKLYRASDLPAIRAALIAHLESLQELQAA